MPLMVSETKSWQDSSQTPVTQPLLPEGSQPHQEQENEEDETDTTQTGFIRPQLLDPHVVISNRPGNGSASVEPVPSRLYANIEDCFKSGDAVCHATDRDHEMTPIPTRAEFTMKQLGWLTCPVTTCQEDGPLPAISVYSDPEVHEELEMIIHSNGEGTAQTTGQRRVTLRSQGSNKPSVATFEGIRIKRAGLYVIEVHAVRQPELSLVADHPTRIVPSYETQESAELSLQEEHLGLGIIGSKVQMWGGGPN